MALSRHEGVSCDVCMKSNFSGRRYKCLVCYDFDLCAECHEAGLVGNQHTTNHPVQCILTRSDYELFYGNEQASLEHPQSLACPFCRQLGFTDSTLHEHVASEHADSRFQVICPACAATPHGDPNRMTDDLASHLAVEHVSRRDTTVEESRAARRLPHGTARSSAGLIARGSRGRGHTSNQAGHLAFTREPAAASDPITELLSQLGGMRRASSSYSSTLQQIQQLQQQLGRGGARRAIVATMPGGNRERGGGSGEGPYGEMWWDELAAATGGRPAAIILGESGQPTAAVTGSTAAAIKEELRNRAAASSGSVVTLAPPPPTVNSASDMDGRCLLARLQEENLSEDDLLARETELKDRSNFTQELFLSTLSSDFSSIDISSMDARKDKVPSKERQGNRDRGAKDVVVSSGTDRIEGGKSGSGGISGRQKPAFVPTQHNISISAARSQNIGSSPIQAVSVNCDITPSHNTPTNSSRNSSGHQVQSSVRAMTRVHTSSTGSGTVVQNY